MNYLRIEALCAGENGIPEWLPLIEDCHYAMTEISQAYADMASVAKAHPGTSLRIVSITVTVVHTQMRVGPV